MTENTGEGLDEYGLMPCRKCGSRNTSIDQFSVNDNRYVRECSDCDYMTETCETQAEATALWNRRPTSAGQSELATADKLARRMGGRFVPHEHVGQGEGTSRCPICGIDTPHKHSAQEVREWRESEAWVQKSWEHFQEKYADKFRAAEMAGDLRRAEQWLRSISEWLLTTGNDMRLPGGILDTDPLDLADSLAALSSPPKDNS